MRDVHVEDALRAGTILPAAPSSSATIKGAARVNHSSARIVAVASYSPVVNPSEGLTGAPPGQV